MPAPAPPRSAGGRAAGSRASAWWGSRLRGSLLVRNTGAMLLGESGRVALQAVYFLLLARTLAAEQFGVFAATVALVGTVVPLVGVGSGNLLIRHLATRPTPGEQSDGARPERAQSDDTQPDTSHPDNAVHWANTVTLTLVTGVLLGALLLAFTPWLEPSGATWTLVAAVAVADLLLAPLTSIAAQAHQGMQRLGRTALAGTWVSAGRLVGILVLLAGPWHATAALWAWVYLATSVPAALVTTRTVTALLGWARPDAAMMRAGLPLGFTFSVSAASKSVYNDIDKAMLGRLGSAQAAGLYTVAYRFVDLAFTPMRAILGAAYPRFFQEGSRGLAAALPFTRRIAVPGVGYCLVASASLALGAPLLPLVLGSSYDASVGALQGLSVLPLLKATHYLAADSLTGAGYQRLRTAAQIAVAVVNVGLNLWLIPAYSWRGAVASSLVCDGLLAVTLWATIAWRLRLLRRDGAGRGGAVSDDPATTP